MPTPETRPPVDGIVPPGTTIETPESKASTLDSILASLLALRQAEVGLNDLYTYEIKPGTKQIRVPTGDGSYDMKKRPDSDFIFTPKLALIENASTNELTGDGELPLTAELKTKIAKQVKEVVEQIIRLSASVKKAGTALFNSPVLQAELQAVFGNEIKIKSWEAVDTSIKDELRPFFELWQKKQAELQIQYSKQQKQFKGSIDIENIIDGDKIDVLAAWQITGLDNPMDKLSDKKQLAFKQMLKKVFSLPGEHQHLKPLFFIGNEFTCGNQNAVAQLLEYFHQEKISARTIEIDYNEADIQSMITKAEQSLSNIPETLTNNIVGGAGAGENGFDTELKYNETEAKRLGLERVELKAYPEVDALIEQVIAGTIDITTPDGRLIFENEWQRNCPNLPLPCVPDASGDHTKGYYWYLERLSQNRIVSSLTDNRKTIKPNFGSQETIFVDSSFPEVDYDAVDADGNKILQTVISPLLREFIPNQVGVVNIRRQDIDYALWEDGPANRKPSAKHLAVLAKLGLDPKEWEFHCPRQEQMARASVTDSESLVKDYGKKNLYTNLDHYVRGDDGERYGLYGGYRENGGASRVAYDSRERVAGSLAVRLVLSRKLK